MSVHLVYIATRRNVGQWMFPLAVVLVLLLEYSNGLVWSDYLWPDMSVLVAFSIVLIGPCIAGATAWMVARERLCRLDDLLISTPTSAFMRWTAYWLGTSVWGVLSYTVTGGILVGLTMRNAVWGGPTLWPMLVGVLAVPAYAALGGAAGLFLRARSAPAITAVTALMAEIIAGRFGRDIGMPFLSYLSPAGVLNTSVWYGVRPNVALVQTLMLLGLTSLGLGAMAWRADELKLTRGLLAMGLLLAGASSALLIAHAPPSWQTLRDQLGSAKGIVAQDHAVVPYTPVCASTHVPVCMHPAYQRFLGGDAATINRLLAPLQGIAGAPVRAMQTPGKQGVVQGTLYFVLSNWPKDDPSMPANLSRVQSFFGPITASLVQDSGPPACTSKGVPPCASRTCPGAGWRSCEEAQEALAIWLARRAGLHVTSIDRNGTWSYPFVGDNLKATSAAARRLASLAPAQRHAWLRAHYVALRQGRVSIAEMP
jgi:hypothetical protein